MISLKIQNLVLIEKAEISFGPGLNILTGETGAGKSAILSAIRLIAGDRAESQMIRKGADSAVVEALFENGAHVRREIYRSGKNRCFIDEAQVPLSGLRAAVDIEMVDQSSSQTLLEQERPWLDAFAGLQGEVSAYEAAHAEEKKSEAELEQLLQTPKERELEWALKDLHLIEETHWQVGEEEKLTEEHHFLTHAQELAEKISAVAFTLTESGELPSLNRSLTLLEQCLRFDKELTPLAQSMKSALLELQEVGRSISSYSDRLEVNPQRLTTVEQRIAAIESLKRRFGPEIGAQKEKLQATIDHLSHIDSQIAALRASLLRLQAENQRRAQAITEQRKRAAQQLSPQVLQELRSLNMPHAQFNISVSDTFNDVRFLFSANPGVAPQPLEHCASGGELSRLLLALKTVLSSGASCLVFDEIDSNVGGQTATILGEKLQRLAAKRQVICVTHFVQVAKCATDHFLVAKIEKEQQAYTTIAKLDAKTKETEYNRMLGHAK